MIAKPRYGFDSANKQKTLKRASACIERHSVVHALNDRVLHDSDSEHNGLQPSATRFHGGLQARAARLDSVHKKQKALTSPSACIERHSVVHALNDRVPHDSDSAHNGLQTSATRSHDGLRKSAARFHDGLQASAAFRSACVA
jgi:hypothetical protein